jgi:Cys-tRNA synthase (O-phospho-L-seryl-tRNA:Cys-tRNA synthase)
MRPIELQDGYMVCTLCRGYVDATELHPACECIIDDDD